tara:strand:- start:56 stop:322 length:267 start_codon:yes stop_codon:yes gene_type:complete
VVNGLVVRVIDQGQSKILINLVRIGTIYSVKTNLRHLRDLFVVPKTAKIIKNNIFVVENMSKYSKNKTENLMCIERETQRLMRGRRER